MSILTIHEAARPAQFERIDDPAVIAARLGEIDVLFERWKTKLESGASLTQAEIIEAYRSSVDRLMDRYEFQSVDVVSLTPEHPDRDALRAKFLSEHTHAEFEVRFFIRGQGLFFLHEKDRVFVVLCEQGDLISVPSGMRHWFDMGPHPDFQCIRFFTNPEGWVAQYSGDAIADRFPPFEQYLRAVS